LHPRFSCRISRGKSKFLIILDLDIEERILAYLDAMAYGFSDDLGPDTPDANSI